jgi:hypothetical protein
MQQCHLTYSKGREDFITARNLRIDAYAREVTDPD